MKNILTLFLLLFSFDAAADVIPPKSHALKRCVKIVNLDKFPDIVLISSIHGPMTKCKIAKIKNNECLKKGYKFNVLDIYWHEKNQPDVVNSANLLLKNAEVYGGYVDEKNPLIKEEIEYSLAKSAEGKFILYKSKQTAEYNDGTGRKIETFTNPL